MLPDENLGVPVTVPHLISSLLAPPRGGFLAELLRQECKTGEVENGNELSESETESSQNNVLWDVTNREGAYRSPDVEHDIGGLGQGVPAGSLGILGPVPSADLAEGQDDDDNSEEHVEVVLQWTAPESGFGLELVDDVADEHLDDVEDEERKSELLSYGLDTDTREADQKFATYRVDVCEVRTATFGDGRDSESETDDDNRAGNEGLDGLMSLEPNGGRGPEVTGDQSTQGQQKQKSDDTENSMSDDHSVGLGQRQRVFVAASASTASTSTSGGGRSGTRGRSRAECPSKIKGRQAIVRMLGDGGADGGRAGVGSAKSVDDVLTANCGNLKRWKCKHRRPKRETRLLTGIVNANFGFEAVT